MAAVSISTCPIDMSFDLDEALTLPQDPSHCNIATSDNLVVDLPTVDTTAVPATAASTDICSVCMECFRPGEGGTKSPAAMSTTKHALPSGPYTITLALFAVVQYSKAAKIELWKNS